MPPAATETRWGVRRFFRFRLDTLLLLTILGAAAWKWHTWPDTVTEHNAGNGTVVVAQKRGAAYHGWYSLSDREGRLLLRGRHSNGVRVGPWKAYHPNQRVAMEFHYVAGEFDGPWREWDEEGALKMEAFLRSGKLQGDFRMLWPDGQVRAEGKYVEGVRHGPWKTLYPNGSLRAAGEYLEGEPQFGFTVWDEQGRPIADPPTLPRMFDPASVPEFAKQLAEGDLDERFDAAYALSRLKKPGAQALATQLASQDPLDRALAAQTLAEMGRDAEPAADALIAALQATDARTRLRSAVALGGIGPPAAQAIPALVASIEDGAHFHDLIILRQAVAQIDGKHVQGAKALLAMLLLPKLGTDRPRLLEAIALAGDGSEEAFLAALASPEVAMRLGALQALENRAERTAWPDAVASAIANLRESDAATSVQEAAASALLANERRKSTFKPE